MRLYFDCCCYNRPFDDQSQQRIHDESEAILSLMNRCSAVRGTILGSAVLRLEIDRIGDTVKRFGISIELSMRMLDTRRRFVSVPRRFGSIP